METMLGIKRAAGSRDEAAGAASGAQWLELAIASAGHRLSDSRYLAPSSRSTRRQTPARMPAFRGIAVVWRSHVGWRSASERFSTARTGSFDPEQIFESPISPPIWRRSFLSFLGDGARASYRRAAVVDIRRIDGTQGRLLTGGWVQRNRKRRRGPRCATQEASCREQ